MVVSWIPRRPQTGFPPKRILDILWDYVQPGSVLDVGRGIGTWLAALQSRGVKDVCGIDGPWLNRWQPEV
jgi:2-polyprenyl-3-methyl-5-hydroxy-6-metoxy-1,4-benzoquinol methylase